MTIRNRIVIQHRGLLFIVGIVVFCFIVEVREEEEEEMKRYLGFLCT